MNKNELSYLTSDGFTVFTSTYHRKRGTCCKSSCLHCPYGYTLKKCGLTFQPATEEDSSFVEELIVGRDWRAFLPENLQLILLKGHKVGVMIKNHIVVKEVFLLSEFSNQGLDKDLIESYFFIT